MTELELLKKLVAIPSITPTSDVEKTLAGEARVADFLTELGHEYGLEPRRIEPTPGRPSLIFEIGNPAKPLLAAVAHMDTVNVPGFANPFELIRQPDNTWNGLGACDNKGSIASVFSALIKIHHESPECHFAAVFTCGEECEMRGIKDILHSGFRPDAFTICEGTRLNVVTMHKGTLRLKVRTHGKAAHSSLVPAGENAIYHAAKLVLAVEALNAEYISCIRNNFLKYPTLNVGTIHGGANPNSVPDFCEITIDRRLLPGETEEAAEKELSDAMSRTGVPFEIEPYHYSPPFILSPEHHSFCDLMLSCIKQYRPNAQETGLYCATEAGFAQEIAGVPCVVFGPGDVANAHSVRDSVSEEDLKDVTSVIAKVAVIFSTQEKGK